jgi:hypothetical protein
VDPILVSLLDVNCVNGETNKWTGYDGDLGLKLNKICHAGERELLLHFLSVGNDGL